MLAQSFIAALMAANAEDALDSQSSAGFAAAYAGMRILLVVQYLRARRLRATRKLATQYATGFGVAAALWLASAVTPVPFRYYVWAAALLIDFATPWIPAKHTMNAPPDPSHYPERFGLFTIILLGEFVIAVMHGISGQPEWSVTAATTAFSGVAFAFLIRWWYFDVAQAASERHVRSRRQARLFHIWQYCHLPMFLAIAVAGIGFQKAIQMASFAKVARGEVLIFSAALLILVTTLGALKAVSPPMPA